MNKTEFAKRFVAILLATANIASLSQPAQAANDAARPTAEAQKEPTYLDDVIVTARKRQESILNVPVVETAVTKGTLERLQVSDLKDLQTLVPGLSLGHALLSIGTLVSIRGIGTSAQDSGVDQSVSLNIDGMSMGQGLAFQSGMFDVGQVEVLKGPQALFYGKSSPGGVISIRTADPTNAFEVSAKAGYEFESRLKQGELVISGPVSDTLKLRLAGLYANGDGYFRNIAVPAPQYGAVAPKSRETQPRNAIVRATALWNPTDQFSARLKANWARDYSVDAETSQISSCPDGPGEAPFNGIPFIGGDNCKLDRDLRVVYMNPANFPGIPHNGVPYLTNRQQYGTLELNYKLKPDLTLTSTTGLYHLNSDVLVNPNHSTQAGPTFAGVNHLRRHDTTEELRLNSEFANPMNFTLGGFYQDAQLSNLVDLIGNSAYSLPAHLQYGSTTVNIKAASAFGQLRWQIVPQVELAGGVRWTDEKRDEAVTNLITGAPTLVAVANPQMKSKNWAPELTLTYKPTTDVTLFAAYKQGYKSGSFSISTVTAAGADNSFGDERVKGGEAGLKARLMDRQLTFNLAAYDYVYKGLQVGAIQPSSTGLIVTRTVNAGGAKTYGLDFDTIFHPQAVEGLGLNLAVNWNHGRYTDLTNVPCYGGQTIAQGCNRILNTQTGLFTAQDLSNTPLVRAPAWQTTFGFDYEIPVGSKMKLVLSSSNQYSSKFVTFLAAGRPNEDNYQQGFLKADLSLALRAEDDRWEVALIGKDINDKLTAGNCSAVSLSNGVIFGQQVTGGTIQGAAKNSEVGCYTDPGREIWIRVTYRPFSGR